MIFGSKQILDSIVKELAAIRSDMVCRTDYNSLYGVVKKIQLDLNSSKDSIIPKTNLETPSIKNLEDELVETSIYKIIISTYLALANITLNVSSPVKSSDISSAFRELAINRHLFSKIMNKHERLIIISKIDIPFDLVLFEDCENYHNMSFVSDTNKSSVAKRYPTLYIINNDLSLLTIDNVEYNINEHPAFILTAMMYLLNKTEDDGDLIFTA